MTEAAISFQDSAPLAAAAPTPLLKVSGLRTGFSTRRGYLQVVDNIDLDIAAGKTLCMVGESGSGKSVAARSIMRIVDYPGRIDPSSAIQFEGRDLVRLTEQEMRRIRGASIAMVFQEPMSALNPVLTVGKQIAEPLLLHKLASEEEAMRRAVEMMELVGIPSPGIRAKNYPHEMSGGMLQRVVIAMALICRPRLLVADEPTTALDVTVQAQILDLLRGLQKDLGMAMLMITHDLGVAWEMADDVAVMYAGQIVEHGPATEVLGKPGHPYTEALLRSVPKLGMSQETKLHVIPGVVPNAAEWPAGCRFAARCDHRMAICNTSQPPSFMRNSQISRCWLRGQPGSAGQG